MIVWDGGTIHPSDSKFSLGGRYLKVLLRWIKANFSRKAAGIRIIQVPDYSRFFNKDKEGNIMGPTDLAGISRIPDYSGAGILRFDCTPKYDARIESYTLHKT